MYAAWSPDSRYLAATSDSLHAVAVWRVHVSTSRTDGGEVGGATGWRTWEITRTRARPSLLPSDPNIVVWAERGGRVHAYDLRCAVAAAESTSSAVDLSPPKRREAPLAAAAREAAAAGEADADDDGSGSGSRSDDGWEPVAGGGRRRQSLPIGGRVRRGRARRERPATILQTIRSRVRGLYVTGLCAAAAADRPPFARRRTDAARAYRARSRRVSNTSPAARSRVHRGAQRRVEISVSRGVDPGDARRLDSRFARAARAFLLCAEACARRGGGGGGGGPRSAICRGRLFCARGYGGGAVIGVDRRRRGRRRGGGADVSLATDSR